ncbi:MAG: 2-hydroxyacyl-CoA dehydratase family protein [Syntrophaceae bacterium]
MLNEFHKIGKELFNNHLKQWKNAGKKVIGYNCGHVPEEVIASAGMLPYRVRGIGADSTSIADTYFGPVICSYPKCILQLAGEGKYNFLDGMIFSPGCDSIRRLDDCWRKAAEESHGVFPGYRFYLGIPHKVTDYSLEWFISEVRRFIASLSEHFGVTIGDKDLRVSIKEYNKSRTLLKKLDELRFQDNVPISGADATAVIIAANAMPRDAYNAALEKLIAKLKKSGSGLNGKKRLILGGSAHDDSDIVALIESSGVVVVGDTLCFGSRSYVDLIEEDGDPVTAIAKRYLTRNPCPRVFGSYKERLAYMRERVKDTKADAVILQNIRFCDMHGAENSLCERDLEAAGIPCLKIEREYGPMAEEGRIKMRVDAFVENLRA